MQSLLIRRMQATVIRIYHRSLYLPKNNSGSNFSLRSSYFIRNLSRNTKVPDSNIGKSSAVIYTVAGGIFMIGVTYGAVPIYRRFCQQTGAGGSSELGRGSAERLHEMTPVRERPITVEFTADIHSSLTWNFRPQQTELSVVLGETALAFYTATNPTDQPVTGIATYNIVPAEAAKYFNKIQCFCFEEQRLNPHEQVDMPVFFFIDTDYDSDPRLMRIDRILLSYTFFEAKENFTLPMPGYATS